MWRWWVPVGLTAMAVTAHLILNAFPDWQYRHYRFGVLTFAWISWFVVASPTILYYRLLIWLGEHGVRRWPFLGVAIAVAAGAIIPPLVHNLLAERAKSSLNFRSPPPAKIATIAIEPREGLDACGETCLRLLYGNVVQRVVVGRPSSPTYAFRLERWPVCPIDPPIAGREGADWYWRETVGWAIAHMASGQCLIRTSADFDDADVRLRTGRIDQRDGGPLWPGRFAMTDVRFDYVEMRTGQGWKKLSQQVMGSFEVRWSYPFGFLPILDWFPTWFAADREYVQSPWTYSSEREPWRWAGIRLSKVPEPDEFEVRRFLLAALETSTVQPDYVRNILRRYLLRLADRPIDDIDRALIVRLIADSRFPVGPYAALAKNPGAPPIGLLLARRLRLADRDSTEAHALSCELIELPKQQWAAALPELRKLAVAPDFASGDNGLFRPFEIDGAGDVTVRARPGDCDRNRWAPDRGEAAGPVFRVIAPIKPRKMILDALMLIGLLTGATAMSIFVQRRIQRKGKGRTRLDRRRIRGKATNDG